MNELVTFFASRFQLLETLRDSAMETVAGEYSMVRTTTTISILLSLLLLGCGEGDPPGPGGGGGGTNNPDGGETGPQIDGGIDLPDAAMNAEGPLVTLLTPSQPAMGDFSSDAILTSGRFTARCEAATNPSTGDRVDTTTVRISASSASGTFEADGLPTGVANEFAADLVINDFSNGPVNIRCTASDLAEEPRENSDSTDTFLDLGPVIQVLTPIANTSYANQTDVVFTVSDAPVAAGDTLAAVDLANVEVAIAGGTITGFQNVAGTFTGTIVFDDPAFDPSLEGSQTLTVRAPNQRTSEAVVRVSDTIFNVDSDGPIISLNTPQPGELVAGIMSISVNADDPTGILNSSVVATIAGIHEVQLNLVGGDEYSALFDTRLLGPMVFPNIIVRARDATGNQNSLGFVIGLDNEAPTLSLDSPNLRESQVTSGVLQCSQSFDPLGDDSVDDGEAVAQLFELRARLEDRANFASSTSTVIIPLADVDPASVDLFILDDETGALLVDTDGDGICDEINPLLVPTSVPNSSSEVAAIQLLPIPAAGGSFFGPDEAPTFAATNNNNCTAKNDASAPDPLCFSTPLSRVIATETTGAPAIYGVPPAAGLQCVGNALDTVAANLDDGWACLAVRGSDALGNLNVSAPLRLCIDADENGSDGCHTTGTVSLIGAPNCTGTYDSQTDTVDASTPCTCCQSRSFLNRPCAESISSVTSQVAL